MSRYCNANELHVKGETARLKRVCIITVYNIEMNGCMFVCVGTDQVRIQRGGGGGQGVPTPLENHKIIGFLSNTGPDPLKNHKATKLAFNVGPSSALQRNAI